MTVTFTDLRPNRRGLAWVKRGDPTGLRSIPEPVEAAELPPELEALATGLGTVNDTFETGRIRLGWTPLRVTCRIGLPAPGTGGPSHPECTSAGVG